MAQANGIALNPHVWSSAVAQAASKQFIAAYTLVDGIGARLSGSALGFYAWLAIGNAIAMMLATCSMQSGILRDVANNTKTVIVLGGGGIVRGLHADYLGLHASSHCAGDCAERDQHRIRSFA